MDTALYTLKVFLGMAGRGDFLTYSPTVPADIVYPREKVCVFVLDCFGYACPDHGKPEDQFTAAGNRNRAAVLANAETLKTLGWQPIIFYGCRIIVSERRAVGEVLEALDAGLARMPRFVLGQAGVNLVERAMLANTDAIMRVPLAEWIDFLVVLSVMPEQFSLADMEEGFRRKRRDINWLTLHRVASHHDLIRPGLVAGDLLDPVLELHGLRRITQNPKTEDSDGEQLS